MTTHASAPGSPAAPWLMTGDHPQALRRNAAMLRDHLADESEVDLAGVGASLAARADRRHRAALIGADATQMRDELAALASGAPSAGVVRGMVRGDDRPVMVFPGQGWQWAGMATKLRRESAVFADRFAQCDEALAEYLDISLVDLLDGDGWDDVTQMQPLLWAVMVSLARQWESVGVVPAAVLGHSQGETAAAVVSGALSLEDGARVVAAYARAIKHRLSGTGGMVSIGLRADQVEALIRPWNDRVWVGVHNGPSVTVVSGEPQALTEVLAACEAEGAWARRVDMDYAPHCPMVDPVTEELRAAFSTVEARPSRIPFYSTVTGGVVDSATLDAEYWVANLRSPIRFVDAVQTMLSDGYRVFVEASAHPVLGVGMQEAFDEAGIGAQAIALGTLRRGEDGAHRFLASRAGLWANGVAMDWSTEFPDAEYAELPAEESPAPETETVFADIADLHVDAQRLRLVDLVRRHTAAVLGVDIGEVDPQLSFRDAGLDSPRAVELRASLNDATGLDLPAAVAYACPTPADLAERIRRELTGATETVSARRVVTEPDEPVAIVGMACRFPGGVESPEDLWRLVIDEVDAIGDFPTDRGWNLDELYDPTGERRGASYVNKGAFLHDAAEFDAEFFGISPREALTMDPQQRLTLETAWEALERAGIDPTTLKGTDTGVFIGASAQEYGSRLDQAPEGLEGQMLTGTTNSVVSGRVAYTLGLEGPALTVDTACSASLVSLHLAMQGLRQGDCSLAIAGGVTVMARPGMYVEISRQGGLAPDGRCKAFSASADGTNWAEGVGMLAVERVSDARRRGHRILAVVRGSAINQDGASNGLTAPSGPAQERVIRNALAAADLRPHDVDAVEAHGTGTKLGDPIEAQAILNTYGQGRDREQPLYLGSLKSNIGHAQTTAGVGGVIKMVMAIRNGRLPKTLHVDEPTPHVDWSTGAVELLREHVAWPDRGRARRAAVSSFGISGTNAHVILEQDPDSLEPLGSHCQDGGKALWMLSAQTPDALAACAERLAVYARENPTLGTTDIGYSLATTRSAFTHRAAIVGDSRDELLSGVDAIAVGDESPESVALATAKPHSVGPVMVFPGHGSQWVGMGVELAQQFPVFKQSMDECAAALRLHTGRDLWNDLNGDITPIEVVQPLLWAVMVSLARLWRSVGIEPSAVVGHSQGEVAAAVVSGALSLEDGAKVIALRSTLAKRLSGLGDIVSVALSAKGVEQRISKFPGVGIAAVNGPEATVVVGDNADLDAFVDECEADGIQTRRIAAGYPTHSVHVDVVREELISLIEGIQPRRGNIPIWSTVTGEVVSGDLMDAQYWYANLRHTVQFEPVVRELIASGHTAFIEASPHPVLTTALQHIADDCDSGIVVTETLRRDDGDDGRFLTSLAAAHANGVHGVDWQSVFPNAQQVALPTYPFQRERYWLSAPTTGQDLDAGLLGIQVESLADTDQVLLTASVCAADGGWLVEHSVTGDVLFPGAAVAELVRRAGEAVGCGRVGELTIQRSLRLVGAKRYRLQAVVKEPDADGARPVVLHVREFEVDVGTDWTRIASGVLIGEAQPAVCPEAAGVWPPQGAQRIDISSLYPTLDSQGYEYGPAFQGLTAAWKRGDTVFGEVELAVEQSNEVSEYGIHPALLDSAMHTGLVGRDGHDGPSLPFTWSGFEVNKTGATTVRVVLTHTGPDTMRAVIADQDGGVVATVDSLEVRPLPSSSGPRVVDGRYVPAWVPLQTPDAPVEWHWWNDEQQDCPSHVLRSVPDGPVDEAVPTALNWVQQWLGDERCAQSRLVITSKNETAESAAVLALVRSAHTENPGRFGIVHMPDGVSDRDVAVALSALDAGEFEVDVRGGSLRAARLTRLDIDGGLEIPDGPWRLDVSAPSALAIQSRTTQPLAPGHVRVQLAARGLNFRDVMAWLGVMPDLTGIGVEGAGVVSEVADDVTGLVVGDRVMGLVDDSMADEAVTDARNLAHVPPHWTFVQAAAVPGVLLTAWLSMSERIKPGDRVVVHSATSGVGTVALQVARHLGAEVFATANPAKQHLLRELGLDEAHIASTRNVDFAEKFKATTGGAGVDIVLNSLVGEFTDASLHLLRSGGCLIELGKVDVRDPAEVAAAYNGVEYRYFDLRAESPDRIAAALDWLVGALQDGTFEAPPVTSLPMTRAPEGFEMMRQAAHTGKIVFTNPQKLDPDRTVLITGGTGTLGGLLARHLVTEHGVTQLMLVSRRGPDADGVGELQRELETHGARVRIAACDVTDHAQLKTLLGAIDAEHPLGTVVHAAGVLDDAHVEDLDEERLARVLSAKARAAALLDELTEKLDLQAFVMFSSVAGVIGAPGQANYAAANGYLDGLARQRRRRGLQATSIAWGLWQADSRMTGLSSDELGHVAREGVAELDTDTGLALFDAALATDEPVMVAARLDFPALRQRAAEGDLPALFTDLVSAVKRRSAASRSVDSSDGVHRRLAEASAAERHDMLVEVVCAEGSSVLRLDEGRKLAAHDTFREVGFDSLTAVELRNRLNRICGLKLPSTVVFRHPTPAELAERILSELTFESEPTVLDDVERLRGNLSGLDAEDPNRVEAVSALRDMLKELDVTTLDDDLEAASDEEMYALIDKELGLD